MCYQESPVQSTRSPLHLAMRGSSPSPDLLVSSRTPAFSFDASLVRPIRRNHTERLLLKKHKKESSSCFTLPSQGRRSPEDEGASLAAPPRGRYHQLTNATSQEALVTPSSSPSKSCPSSDCSPVYMRRNRRPDSEGTHTWLHTRTHTYKQSHLALVLIKGIVNTTLMHLDTHLVAHL